MLLRLSTLLALCSILNITTVTAAIKCPVTDDSNTTTTKDCTGTEDTCCTVETATKKFACSAQCEAKDGFEICKPDSDLLKCVMGANEKSFKKLMCPVGLKAKSLAELVPKACDAEAKCCLMKSDEFKCGSNADCNEAGAKTCIPSGTEDCVVNKEKDKLLAALDTCDKDTTLGKVVETCEGDTICESKYKKCQSTEEVKSVELKMNAANNVSKVCWEAYMNCADNIIVCPVSMENTVTTQACAIGDKCCAHNATSSVFSCQKEACRDEDGQCKPTVKEPCTLAFAEDGNSAGRSASEWLLLFGSVAVIPLVR